MPCFTAPVKSGQLLINVLVTDAMQGERDIQKVFTLTDLNDTALREQGVKPCCALLDTGASNSCITQRLAEFLDLNIQGKRQIASVSESTNANLYRVNIHFPISKNIMNDDKVIQEINITNWLNVQAFGIPGISEEFDVLLGVDVILQGALHVSGGQFTFCT